MGPPAFLAWSFAYWTATLTALSCDGPVSESGPVTSRSFPIVRFTGSACAGIEATAKLAARAVPARMLRIIFHPPFQCSTWSRAHRLVAAPRWACSILRRPRQSPVGHEQVVAVADIGVEEHEPSMQARAVHSARFDILPDRHPQDAIPQHRATRT